MTAHTTFRFGLIIRSLAYEHRSARSQLDVAMLAASLDLDLRLYFVGEAVMQLVSREDHHSALLPAGYRAWASLPELIEQAGLITFAEPGWLARLEQNNMQPCLDLVPADSAQMRKDWGSCDRLLLL